MKLDLSLALWGTQPTSVRLKAGWTLEHPLLQPEAVHVTKVLHETPRSTVTLKIEFTQNAAGNLTESMFLIHFHHHNGQPPEELFAVPLPLEVSTNICFTYDF